MLRGVAQLVEQPVLDREVGGSSPLARPYLGLSTRTLPSQYDDSFRRKSTDTGNAVQSSDMWNVVPETTDDEDLRLLAHHLVFSDDDTEVADHNLAQLMRNI